MSKFRSLDQGRSVVTFLDAASEKALRSTVALTASRGRGKVWGAKDGGPAYLRAVYACQPLETKCCGNKVLAETSWRAFFCLSILTHPQVEDLQLPACASH